MRLFADVVYVNAPRTEKRIQNFMYALSLAEESAGLFFWEWFLYSACKCNLMQLWIVWLICWSLQFVSVTCNFSSWHNMLKLFCGGMGLMQDFSLNHGHLLRSCSCVREADGVLLHGVGIRQCLCLYSMCCWTPGCCYQLKILWKLLQEKSLCSSHATPLSQGKKNPTF